MATITAAGLVKSKTMNSPFPGMNPYADDLAEALLDVSSLTDLPAWLEQNQG